MRLCQTTALAVPARRGAVLLRAEQVREVVRHDPVDNGPDRVHAPALRRDRVVRVATAERVVLRAKVAQRRASPNTAIDRRVPVRLARVAMVMRRVVAPRAGMMVAPRAVMTVLLGVRPVNAVSGNHMASAVNASHMASAAIASRTVSVRVARRVRVPVVRAARELVRAATELVQAARDPARAATTIEARAEMIVRFVTRLSSVRSRRLRRRRVRCVREPVVAGRRATASQQHRQSASVSSGSTKVRFEERHAAQHVVLPVVTVRRREFRAFRGPIGLCREQSHARSSAAAAPASRSRHPSVSKRPSMRSSASVTARPRSCSLL